MSNGDELSPAVTNGSQPPLPPDASMDDVIEAINGLAKAMVSFARSSRTHSVELEGIRGALQEHGTRIETFCQRIERALGLARTRDTDPAPKPEGE